MNRALTERLIDTDPLVPMHHLFDGLVRWMDGQLDSALASFQKMAQLEPESVYPKMWGVYVLAWKKQYEDVFALVDQMVRSEQSDRIHEIMAEWCLLFKYALQGDTSKALTILTEDVKSYFWNDPELIWVGASTYALMGEKEEALDWLERAVKRGWIN